MCELPVTAFSHRQAPSVCFEKSNHLAHLHEAPYQPEKITSRTDRFEITRFIAPFDNDSTSPNDYELIGSRSWSVAAKGWAFTSGID